MQSLGMVFREGRHPVTPEYNRGEESTREGAGEGKDDEEVSRDTRKSKKGNTEEQKAQEENEDHEEDADVIFTEVASIPLIGEKFYLSSKKDLKNSQNKIGMHILDEELTAPKQCSMRSVHASGTDQ